ncbi:hypothetical protein GCM10022630_32310 [Thermobifida alba]
MRHGPGPRVHASGLQGLRRRELGRAVNEISEVLQITGYLDRRVGVLSGGQQRRVQAAAAMIHKPAPLLLDEPTAGMDPEARQSFLKAVRDHAHTGATVIYTTHYLPELTELGAEHRTDLARILGGDHAQGRGGG